MEPTKEQTYAEDKNLHLLVNKFSATWDFGRNDSFIFSSKEIATSTTVASEFLMTAENVVLMEPREARQRAVGLHIMLQMMFHIMLQMMFHIMLQMMFHIMLQMMFHIQRLLNMFLWEPVHKEKLTLCRRPIPRGYEAIASLLAKNIITKTHPIRPTRLQHKQIWKENLPYVTNWRNNNPQTTESRLSTHTQLA
jgi:hypothetical protein